MVKIVFIEHDRSEHKVKAKPGGTVMLVAATIAVPGIDADSAGSCSCATCHVFVHDDWLKKVGQMNPTEEVMLSLSPDSNDNSRLSCQIPVDEELDGLVITMPEFQILTKFSNMLRNRTYQ